MNKIERHYIYIWAQDSHEQGFYWGEGAYDIMRTVKWGWQIFIQKYKYFWENFPLVFGNIKVVLN